MLPKVSAALGRSFEDEDTNIAGLFEDEGTSKLGSSKMNQVQVERGDMLLRIMRSSRFLIGGRFKRREETC